MPYFLKRYLKIIWKHNLGFYDDKKLMNSFRPE